jgi:hypothetical protein
MASGAGPKAGAPEQPRAKRYFLTGVGVGVASTLARKTAGGLSNWLNVKSLIE